MAKLSLPRRLARDERGVAAVEAAFLAPVALLFLGLVVAAGESLTIYHKVVMTAHEVTDLVSRTPFKVDNVTNTQGAELIYQSDLDVNLALSNLVMQPNDTTNLVVVMSELQLKNNVWKVVWSEAYPAGNTALSVGTVINLDASYAADGATYMAYGQVTYSFQPLGGVLAVPAMTFNATDALTIRNATQITVAWGQ